MVITPATKALRGLSRPLNAANDDDDEGEDQDVLTHADLDEGQRRLHHSGKTGEGGTEPEYEGVEELNIDAERADHLAVGGTGADQHADARAHHQRIQQERNRQRRQNDNQPIERVVDSRQNLNRAEHLRRERQRQAGRPPDQPHQFVEEQQQAEGAEHLVKVIASVERPDRNHLKRHSGHQRREQRQSDAGQETVGERCKCCGEVRAEHVERAVRQIDQIHDAKDQGQAGCEQK